MLDRRGQLLRAAVGFADRALHGLRTWLNSWTGIGHVAMGMARQGYDLQLTRYDERGWRATFYVTGMEHSPTSATGTGWERTPWHATQRAALEALKATDWRAHAQYGGRLLTIRSWSIVIAGIVIAFGIFSAGRIVAQAVRAFAAVLPNCAERTGT